MTNKYLEKMAGNAEDERAGKIRAASTVGTYAGMVGGLAAQKKLSNMHDSAIASQAGIEKFKAKAKGTATMPWGNALNKEQTKSLYSKLGPAPKLSLKNQVMAKAKFVKGSPFGGLLVGGIATGMAAGALATHLTKPKNKA